MAPKLIHQTGARSGFSSSGKSAAVLAVLVFICAVALCSDTRPLLLPQLKPGQTLLYEVHGRLNRTVKTQSNVSTLFGPPQLQGELSSQIRLSVQKVLAGKPHPIATVQTELLPAVNATNRSTPLPSQKLTFDILGSGQLGNVNGLEDLSPEQRLIWQFWVARFAFGWVLPPKRLKPGEKWKFEEPELNDSLIAGLVWERETTYARDDQCPVFPAETCAVFLTQSTLKQKSSTKDSTPEAYRLHELKTLGSANGHNQVITYISRKTGIVLRANEDVQQSMDVTVMKTDGTNGVHYTVKATSHLETLFVPQPAGASAP
ncbi:MAG TPA: hypothetical protein VG075_02975 [Candidatus Acidoferrum sp.]|jgi:hypothetical protein|nr:hypothetical protein [Candidatus Acidoferrum sp.]